MTCAQIPFCSYGCEVAPDGDSAEYHIVHSRRAAGSPEENCRPGRGDSLLIELAQLISYRGLFEFDDVIHNALGTAIGVLIVLGMKRLLKR